MIKKIFNLSILFLFLFILLNICLSIIWPFITNLSLKSKTFYSDKILELIEITPTEQLDFYKETWISRKFTYVQFIGQYEKTKNNQKYVNVDIENGRKIKNNKFCKKNFFFYGSSHTFGYNIKDNQTIAAQFKIILDKNYKNYCVYNFGSGSFYSTQETIFFMTHILKDKIKKKDFIFFLDGLAEEGNKQTAMSKHLKGMHEYFNLKYWDRYYFGASFFWKSLPVNQLYNRYLQKNRNEATNILTKPEKIKKKEIFDVFQKNILIRRGICLELEINCYNFLQPFPIMMNENDSNLITKAKDIELKEQYELLKNTKYVFDLSKSLKNLVELSHVDAGGHYSPKASTKIANDIYLIISDTLKND
jgi:hypothetical protein